MCLASKLYRSLLIVLVTCQSLCAASTSAMADQRDQLFKACADGDMQAITTLAQQGADMNCIDIAGWTPIHHAAANGDVPLFQTLIKHGARVDALIATNNATALHLSTIFRQHKLTHVLLEEYQMNPAAHDDEQITPLHYAAGLGYEEFIHFFMQRFPRIVNIRDIYGKTPLHHAAESGKTTIAHTLITAYQADIFASDRNGLTPMHYAAAEEHDHTANYLFLHHPDLIQLRDHKDKTPLMHVVNNAYMTSFILGKIADRAKVLVLIQDFLMQPSDQADNCLICALRPSSDYAQATDSTTICCARCMERILHHPQRTPLHTLAALGHMILAQNLIAEHPEYSTTLDENGMLPLHWAAHANQSQTAALLLEHAPATLHSTDYDQNTPLMYASVHAVPDTLNVLLAAMHANALQLLQTPEVQARLSGLCASCTHAPVDPTTPACCVGAVYCNDCLEKCITSDHPFCPACQEGLYTEMLITLPAS